MEGLLVLGWLSHQVRHISGDRSGEVGIGSAVTALFNEHLLKESLLRGSCLGHHDTWGHMPLLTQSIDGLAQEAALRRGQEASFVLPLRTCERKS